MYVPSLLDRVAGSAALRRRQALARDVARLVCRVEIDGIERLPLAGPVVLAVNHRSALDGVMIFGLVERPVNWVVKAEAFTPVMAPVLRGAGQIPVRRGQASPGSIRLCLRVLTSGGVVGIFPEGSRGDGLAHTAKPGVGYFALRSGAAVLPIACHGTEALARRQSMGRPPVRITFGDPLTIERYPTELPLNRRVVADATEHIRSVLARLVAETAPRTTPRRAAA